MDITRLIALADEIISCNTEDKGIIDRIEDYFDAVDDALPYLEKSAKKHEAELRVLFEKHNTILGITGSLKEDASREIRELKKRGKGILAYRDLLPRRISLGTSRKG